MRRRAVFKIPKLFFGALFFVFMIAPGVRAQAVELEAELGYGANASVGELVPLKVTIRSPFSFSGSLEVRTRGFPFFEVPVEHEAGRDLAFTTYIRLPPQNMVLVLFDDQGRKILELKEHEFQGSGRTYGNDLRVLEVSREPLLLRGLAEYSFSAGRSRGSKVQMTHVDPKTLPFHYAGLESTDAIIIGDLNFDEISPAVQAAIRAWVLRGGLLIVRGGSAGAELPGSFLTPLLPVKITGTQRTTAPLFSDDTEPPYVLVDGELKDDAVLTHASSALRSAMQTYMNGVPVYPEEMIGSVDEPAIETFSSGELSLVWRRNWGSGEVRQLAFDPGAAPFRDTSATVSLIFGAADQNRASASPSYPGRRINAAGPLHKSALTELSNMINIPPPSIGIIVLFMLAYAVIVGPVNFFFLSRRQRRELAWVTIPGIVVVFTVLAFVMGYFTMGRSTSYRELSFVVADMDAGVEEATTYGGIYSSGTKDYSYRFPSRTIAAYEMNADDNMEIPTVVFKGVPPSSTDEFSVANWSWEYVKAYSTEDITYDVILDPSSKAVTITGDIGAETVSIREGMQYYMLKEEEAGSYVVDGGLYSRGVGLHEPDGTFRPAVQTNLNSSPDPNSSLNRFIEVSGGFASTIVIIERTVTETRLKAEGTQNSQGKEYLIVIPKQKAGDDA